MSTLLVAIASGIGVAPALAAVFTAFTTIYVVCLIVGGGLLVISTVLGGQGDAGMDASVDAPDVDVDIQPDVDVGADVDAPDLGGDALTPEGHVAADGLSLASWFSIRFLVYFVAVFGAVGTVLSYTTALSSPVVLLIAILAGLVVGQAVHQTIRYIRRTSGDSATSARDYVQRYARVTVAIGHGQRGEVAAQVRGCERYLPAVAMREEDRFNVGDRVGIVSFADGTVEVVSKQEYEFIHGPRSGDDS